MCIDPQCERLKNAHRNFMKAFKTCIPFLWIFQKLAPLCMTALKRASPLYERVNNAHHGFMKAFKIVNLLLWVLQKFAWWFTKIIKHASPLYVLWRPKTMCISRPWVFQKFASRLMKATKHASPLRWRINKVHHGFMKAVKMRISVLWVFQKCASRLWRPHASARAPQLPRSSSHAQAYRPCANTHTHL